MTQTLQITVALSTIIHMLTYGFVAFLLSMLITPIHHHFEALGWPETKVTMRFWILGQVAGVLGLILFFVGRYR